MKHASAGVRTDDKQLSNGRKGNGRNSRGPERFERLRDREPKASVSVSDESHSCFGHASISQ